MKIAITGTPGTGKTEVARELSEKLNLSVVDLNVLLTEGFILERDEERDTLVVDVERAAAEVRLPRDCIIDGHLSHFIHVDTVVVLRCKPKELYQRLVGKGWSADKVEENVEAEALNIISDEAREINRHVFDIDTTGRPADETARLVVNTLNGRLPEQQLDFLEFL